MCVASISTAARYLTFRYIRVSHCLIVLHHYADHQLIIYQNQTTYLLFTKIK